MKPLDWAWCMVAVMWSALILVEVWRRHKAGKVVVDLGISNSQYQLGAGVLMLIVGVVMMLLSWKARFQGLAYGAWGGGILVSITRKFQFRQAGIFGQRLFRWEDITEYFLDPQGTLSLNLKRSGWTYCRRKVPQDQLQRVREFLADRLPGREQVTVI
jgi:hypothetical protein